MKSSRINLTACVAAFLTLSVVGCGGSTGGRPGPSASVEGTVTFNGAAVAKGVVNFYQKDTGFAATTVVEAGKFKFPDKLAEGNFQVYLTAPVITQAPEPGKMPPPIEDPKDIPDKYRVAETSPLTADLKPGSNSIELTLMP